MTTNTDQGDPMPTSPTTTLLPLRGIRCRRCDHVATPVQTFGCETCGAFGDALADVHLTGQGTVLNAVEVHRSGGAELRIGSVHLEEGPMLRAVLSEHATAGARVHASEVDGVLLFAEIGEVTA